MKRKNILSISLLIFTINACNSSPSYLSEISRPSTSSSPEPSETPRPTPEPNKTPRPTPEPTPVDFKTSIIKTDDSSIPYLILSKDGSSASLLASLSTKKVMGAILTSNKGDSVQLEFDDDGKLTRVLNEKFILLFKNYTDSTVDVAFVQDGNKNAIFRKIPIQNSSPSFSTKALDGQELDYLSRGLGAVEKALEAIEIATNLMDAASNPVGFFKELALTKTFEALKKDELREKGVANPEKVLEKTDIALKAVSCAALAAVPIAGEIACISAGVTLAKAIVGKFKTSVDNARTELDEAESTLKSPPETTGCVIGSCINSKGTFIAPNGDKYEGNWVDGKKEGQGKMAWGYGAKYEGDWVNNQQHGQGTFTYSDGDKYVGTFNKGVQDGQGTFTSIATGKVKSGIFVNGELPGSGSSGSSGSSGNSGNSGIQYFTCTYCDLYSKDPGYTGISMYTKCSNRQSAWEDDPYVGKTSNMCHIYRGYLAHDSPFI